MYFFFICSSKDSQYADDVLIVSQSSQLALPRVMCSGTGFLLLYLPPNCLVYSERGVAHLCVSAVEQYPSGERTAQGHAPEGNDQGIAAWAGSLLTR